jgi:TPR repeat protein
MYGQGLGVGKDNEKAMRWFLLAAEQGNGMAQFDLCVMYANSLGVRQDLVTAYALCSLAQNDFELPPGNVRKAVDKQHRIESLMTTAQLELGHILLQEMKQMGVGEALRQHLSSMNWSPMENSR